MQVDCAIRVLTPATTTQPLTDGRREHERDESIHKVVMETGCRLTGGYHRYEVTCTNNPSDQDYPQLLLVRHLDGMPILVALTLAADYQAAQCQPQRTRASMPSTASPMS